MHQSEYPTLSTYTRLLQLHQQQDMMNMNHPLEYQHQPEAQQCVGMFLYHGKQQEDYIHAQQPPYRLPQLEPLYREMVLDNNQQQGYVQEHNLINSQALQEQDYQLVFEPGQNLINAQAKPLQQQQCGWMLFGRDQEGYSQFLNPINHQMAQQQLQQNQFGGMIIGHNYQQESVKLQDHGKARPRMRRPRNRCKAQGKIKTPSVGTRNDPKTRIRWTTTLHDLFVQAVNELGGPSRATPRTILSLMGTGGLTTLQVKSHLQKYRIRKPGASLFMGQPRIDMIQGNHGNASINWVGPTSTPFQAIEINYEALFAQRDYGKRNQQVQAEAEQIFGIPHHGAEDMECLRMELEKSYKPMTDQNTASAFAQNPFEDYDLYEAFANCSLDNFDPNDFLL